jgi:hypothetical protein
MKKSLFVLTAILGYSSQVSGQIIDKSIDPNYVTQEIVMPPSPLDMQILFIGGVDKVQTVDDQGNPNGEEFAKQWHDFIGFTPDDTDESLGWISVNHERVSANDKIGDGGGMTVFRVKRSSNLDSLEIVSQTLDDGRSGDFFNVDFVNTVGETGMNCGGIVGPTGRIWTAEEWLRSSNEQIFADSTGIRDTTDFTISNSGIDFADGETLKRYQNLNYLVEIDPIQAKAIRKQYNWGRWSFEGGAILDDNKTVFIGVDATPSFMMKFVADTEGDFTSGDLFLYKESANEKWVQIQNSSMNDILTIEDQGVAAGATMFNRLEWVQYERNSNKVYFTETGRDHPGGRWADESAEGAEHAHHHLMRAYQQATHPDSSDYADYYGRVLELDVQSDEVSVFLAGGPEYALETVTSELYPDKHLSNPDGLHIMYIEEKPYMIICEDLNGSSYGRVPEDVATSKTCELWFLDMAITNPTVDDLIRISVVPKGAEVTGAMATPDGQTLLVNSQHPSSDNPYPFNNSLTYAINGWVDFVLAVEEHNIEGKEAMSFYPNPATRSIELSKTSDVGIYDSLGKRIRVYRQVQTIDVSDFEAGVYYIKDLDGETQKLVIQ